MPRALHQLAALREKRELIEATSAIPESVASESSGAKLTGKPTETRPRSRAALNFVRDSVHVIPYDYNANNQPFGSRILLTWQRGQPDRDSALLVHKHLTSAHFIVRPFAAPNRGKVELYDRVFERLQCNRHFRAIRNIWTELDYTDRMIARIQNLLEVSLNFAKFNRF